MITTKGPHWRTTLNGRVSQRPNGQLRARSLMYCSEARVDLMDCLETKSVLWMLRWRSCWRRVACREVMAKTHGRLFKD